MGSSLFRFYSKFFTYFSFSFIENIKTTEGLNCGDQEDFQNYLENLNQTRTNYKYSFNSHVYKSKYLISQISNENEETIEELDTASSQTFRQKLKYFIPKNYLNEISEKDSLSQKIVNKSINRKMRNLRKIVNNISTTDTCIKIKIEEKKLNIFRREYK